MNKLVNATAQLAADYYLKNFRFLLDWVYERYADLLNENERNFIAAFMQLETNAQCLLVRLSSRKGPLFRRDKLKYTEITCLDEAAQQLVGVGLLHTDSVHDLHTLAAAITKPELLTLFGIHLAGLKHARKEIVIEKLAELFPAPRSWQNWTDNRFGTAWYLDNQAIIRTLLLLFFGNTAQNLTEFVLQDLGLFRYETYTIDHQCRIFKNRAELDQYQHLVHLREHLNDKCSVEVLTQLAAQLPSECLSDTLQRRRAKLCNQLAHALERTAEHALALNLYAQSQLPPARERRIRLLEKQGNHAHAWELLSELLTRPLAEQELQVARRMAPRIARKLGMSVSKSLPPVISSYQYELPQTVDLAGHQLRVEEAVRLSLNSASAPCVYAENALLGALFGLWIWPEMFGSVDGAFAHPFQMAPLDLYQENFAAKRPGIAVLWQSFESDQYRYAIRRTWQEKHGIANHFVHWQFITYDLLDMALDTIPAQHLKLIFQRLLFDIENNRSGLPDLIQFFPQQRAYRMIEVKGPGDRIQDNQQRWLEYFAQHQIPAEVCYVRWK